jgi:hypothetical protein
MYIRELLDKAIVKVVNIKNLASKIVCVDYYPCVKKNLFGKKKLIGKENYCKKITWGL